MEKTEVEELKEIIAALRERVKELQLENEELKRELKESKEKE